MASIREAITTLHKAFNELNRIYFAGCLKQPAILIQNQGNRKNILGWCTTREIWKDKAGEEAKYEINITAEYLNRPAEQVITTLLHEMVHLDNIQKGIQDCSRGGTYHNKKFKERAEQCGLKVEAMGKSGWAFTTLTEEGKQVFEGLRINKEAFKIAREAAMPGETKKTNVRKYVCPCCGLIVRATKEVKIICGSCYDDTEELYYLEEV